MLREIIDCKHQDYARFGPTFGVDLPKFRQRPLVPFLAQTGVILEIKRASPSKGDIARDLDPVHLMQQYEQAGAKQISVLTEQRYFKGSLKDLLTVSNVNDRIAFLRKDFILFEDEIEVSYRAGADAVLLIAKMHGIEQLIGLAKACDSYGMVPFIEIHDHEDLQKLLQVLMVVPAIAGVNSRDLTTFRVDTLVPAALRDSIPSKAVFESGVHSASASAYARKLGYDGVLIGEAAAKNPEFARDLATAFLTSVPNAMGAFWQKIAKKVHSTGTRLPLVKICGLTSVQDALHAADSGADILGFIFAPSPRSATADTVRHCARHLEEKKQGIANNRNNALPPLLVGVVVDVNSDAAKTAIGLASEGVLDGIQYHGTNYTRDLPVLDNANNGKGVGRYVVVRIGTQEDLDVCEHLLMNGEPRILVDARIEGLAGGTGRTIAKDLVRKLSANGGLWLAGGLSPANIGSTITEFSPELIDASSSLELVPGIKDHALIDLFLKEVRQ